MNDYTSRKLIDESNIQMNLDMSRGEIKEKNKQIEKDKDE
jgi:hypothetical protein